MNYWPQFFILPCTHTLTTASLCTFPPLDFRLSQWDVRRYDPRKNLKYICVVRCALCQALLSLTSEHVPACPRKGYERPRKHEVAPHQPPANHDWEINAHYCMALTFGHDLLCSVTVAITDTGQVAGVNATDMRSNYQVTAY